MGRACVYHGSYLTEQSVSIKCLACNKLLRNFDIHYDDDELHHSWNFRMQKCNAGHNLLIIGAMHVYAPREIVKQAQ